MVASRVERIAETNPVADHVSDHNVANLVTDWMSVQGMPDVSPVQLR